MNHRNRLLLNVWQLHRHRPFRMQFRRLRLKCNKWRRKPSTAGRCHIVTSKACFKFRWTDHSLFFCTLMEIACLSIRRRRRGRPKKWNRPPYPNTRRRKVRAANPSKLRPYHSFRKASQEFRRFAAQEASLQHYATVRTSFPGARGFFYGLVQARKDHKSSNTIFLLYFPVF